MEFDDRIYGRWWASQLSAPSRWGPSPVLEPDADVEKLERGRPIENLGWDGFPDHFRFRMNMLSIFSHINSKFQLVMWWCHEWRWVLSFSTALCHIIVCGERNGDSLVEYNDFNCWLIKFLVDCEGFTAYLFGALFCFGLLECGGGLEGFSPSHSGSNGWWVSGSSILWAHYETGRLRPEDTLVDMSIHIWSSDFTLSYA